MALLSFQGSGYRSAAAEGPETAETPIVEAATAADPDALDFPLGRPFEPDSGVQMMEGSTFECTYTPELNEMYVPSPEDTSGLVMRAASATDIQITYIGSWPADAQSAFERAVTTWENLVETSAPIRMTATWDSLGTGGILGQGGPWLYGNFTGAPVSNTWYPAALANVLCGCDVDPNQYEFRVTMNADFSAWWYGPGAAPSNKVDFQTTSLHEITHGMGFAGTARVSGGLGTHGNSGYPAAYDRFVEDNAGTAILSYTSGTAQLASALQSNALYFDGPNTRAANGGNRAALYAPATWAQGSSYSHLGNAFDNGTPDALITYALGYGESIHDLGNVTKGVFQDIGWPFAAAPAPTGNLEFNSSTATVAETVAGGTLNIPVVRSGGSSGAASATCAVTSSTATSGSDFTLSTSSVSWTDGDTANKNCVLTIINDSAFEADETVTLALQSITGATAGSPLSTIVTITSEDAGATGTLQFTASTFDVTEGTSSLNVSVSRTGGSDGTASATCARTGGSATNSLDFTLSTTSLSWTNGDSATKNCTILIVNDSSVETSETILMALQSITGTVAGSPVATTVTIVDDDIPAPGTVQFGAATYAATEGTHSSVNIAVTRTGGSDGSASATCLVTGSSTATSTSDYTLTTGSVSWTSGDAATKNCVVGIVNDTAYEPAETVIFNLTSVTGAGTGSPSTTSLTITSNDAVAPGTIRYASATGTAGEANGAYNVAVTRTGGSDGAASATCSQPGGGTATLTTDYTLTTTSVSWADGESGTKNCVLTPVNDSLFESNETVILGLSSVTGASAGSPASTTITITSDDAAANGTLAFGSATYSAGEGAGTLSIPVSRTGGTDGAVGATCSVSGGGTATVTSDFTLSTSSVTWANGASGTKNCVVTIVSDGNVEADETINLSLGSATGGATIGSPSATVVTILNDDNAGIVQFTSATHSVSEAGSAYDVAVSRTGGTSGAVSVTCSVSGSSTASGGDYTASNMTLSWANGESGSKSCRVTPANDSTVEADETVILALGSATGAVTIGTPSTATLTILNDDSAGTIQLTGTAFSVAENGTFVDVTATRTGGTSGAASAVCSATNGTAGGGDYSLSNATLSWTAGEGGTKSCLVTPVSDSLVEANEALTVTLGSVSGAATGSPLAATVTITNDDWAGTIEFTAATFGTTIEGNTLTFTVSRSGGIAGAVSATCAVTTGTTATSGSDFSLATTVVSWADGELGNRSCTVTTVNDSLVESAESIVLVLQSSTGGAGIGDPSTASATITDNDIAGTIAFATSNLGSVGEAAGSVSVAVRRAGGSSGAVSATCSVVVGSQATSPADFSITSATVSWLDGEIGDRTCTVTVVDDSAVESTETAAIQLSGLTGQATLASPTSAGLSIADNDNAGTLSLTATSFSVGEGDEFASVSVQRTGGTSGVVGVTCEFVTGGTAALGDYTLSNMTLSWANGEGGTKACRVNPVDDATPEFDETLLLQLVSATGGATITAPMAAAIVITDNDQSGTLAFTSATFSGSESGGAIILTISRTGGSQGAVFAACTVTGGTADPADYVISGNPSWSNGETGQKTCVITPVDNSDVDGSRTIVVGLQGPTGGAAINPSANSATVTIADDDAPAGPGMTFTDDIPSGGSGQPFAAQPAVVIRDEHGNPVTNSTAVVTLSLVITAQSSNHSLVFTCESGTSVAAVNGVATFSGCRIDIPGGALDVRIQATIDGVLQAISEPFDVLDYGRDATCDGTVDGLDALAVMRALAGIEGGIQPAGDCTGDANANAGLDLGDVRTIRRFIAGLP